MNDATTVSMLQRIPLILAVTAASYGLALPAMVVRRANTQTEAPATEAPVLGPRVEPALRSQEEALAALAMDRG